MKAVDKHVALLEKFERASKDLRVIEQGKETDEFWTMLGFGERPQEAYKHVDEWNFNYLDVSV